MALDKDKIKESLTEADIKLILADLGSDLKLADKMIFQTVCHHGSKHKLHYYDDSKEFHCYTDCGKNMDVYNLAMESKKHQGIELTFPEAVKYIASLTGKYYSADTALDKVNSHLISDWEFINRYKKKKQINKELKVIHNHNVFQLFSPYGHISWLNEGISHETMRKFNISYYLRDDRIVIPHYDIDNNLVGIRGRAMRKEDVDSGRKYMPLLVGKTQYNHQTMLNLYGLHKTKDAIKRLKKIALFESEKSVLMCEDFYGEDNFSAAICGSTLSRFHVQIILSLGIEEVFFCMDKMYHDPDSKEAEIYAKKIMKFANMLSPYCTVYVLWDDFGWIDYREAPCDRGKKVLEDLMKAKYEVKTLNEGAIV
ncbi:hypothetical protein WKH56_19835 [Priestia sp. SB1]|uniref:hypothetical protein n=1 Tax=Priestia sp. SB1 TaxID=3132359 RepID=UPI0031747ACB